MEISETLSMIQIAQLRSELKLYFTAATIPPQYQAGVGTAATIKTVVLVTTIQAQSPRTYMYVYMYVTFPS